MLSVWQTSSSFFFISYLIHRSGDLSPNDCRRISAVFLFLGHPKQLFTELFKCLEVGSLPEIFRVFCGGLNSSIDDLHDEPSVVPVLQKYYLFMAFPLVFNLDVVPYLDPTCPMRSFSSSSALFTSLMAALNLGVPDQNLALINPYRLSLP